MPSQKYKFYANPPVQNNGTVKFVQLSIQANLITKKLGYKYNTNVVKRKLFDYNITPKINTDVVIQNNSNAPESLLGEYDSSNNNAVIGLSNSYAEDNCQELVVPTAPCVNYSKRIKQSRWYRERASNLDQELDDYMSTCTSKQTLDKELEEYMEQGRKAAKELVEVEVKKEIEEN